MKMTSDQKKEYQTVILAELLHDVGKFLRRGNGKYKGSHPAASAKFIENFHDKLKNDSLYDIELVKTLALHHHSIKKKVFGCPLLKDKPQTEKDHFWQLLKIVKVADIYSCMERDHFQNRNSMVDNKRMPLDSVFSSIHLEPEEPLEKKPGRYHACRIDPLTSFPDPSVDFSSLGEKEVPGLIANFERHIPDFSRLEQFDDVLTAWLNILEPFTWAIPSDTRYGHSDISLFDHLRSSAAMAACLHKRHLANMETGENFNRKYEFMFIAGDFSGIQDYIFHVTNLGSGGAAKRLRARSFFVSLFSEAVIHKIIHALDIPLLCNVFSAGGKFLILAPDIDETGKLLQSVKESIENEIHSTYFNQFSFLMSWMRMEEFKANFKVYKFFKVADEMFHRLETEKTQKYRNVLLDQEKGAWQEESFKAGKLYAGYKETGDCKICGRGPATPEIYNDRKGLDEDEERDTCFLCYRDKFLLGQTLPRIKFVAFGRGKLADEEKKKKIVLFNGTEDSSLDYYADLLERPESSRDCYLIHALEETKSDWNVFGGKPFLRKYYANHVPTVTEDNNKTTMCFEDIAKLSRWEKKENGKSIIFGAELLGVLKVDMDNLGFIFSKGFENPSKLEKKNESGKPLREIDRKTASRFLTMSRMIELFFSGWMKEIMDKNREEEIISELKRSGKIDVDRFAKYIGESPVDFKNIYTVYSSGDDMVLVGPWETMIVFSIFLNMRFRKFTSNNKHITLSAGLSFVKPKHPIASAIRQAEELLEKSKREGKDRITFFGTTVEWEKLPDLVNFFLFLNEKLMDKDSKIKTGFAHRLFEYHRMALSFFEEGKIEGLKYLSALSYDMGRNLIKRDAQGKIIRGMEEYIALQPLINDSPNKISLISKVKIPLFWALYRNRRA
ncbi:MAG: type III-A CRISPR-associated protein Cas10/Csm1 [Nitrospinae bacterium]|nr:type III-A CRISPR-associated protein Cas10/Csm1 [Nitrospinota bacterium]